MGFFGFELDRDLFDSRAYKTSIYGDDDYIDYHGYRLPAPINISRDLKAILSEMGTIARQILNELKEAEEKVIIEEDIDGNITMIDGHGLIKEIKP